jgi:hypothetical protein
LMERAGATIPVPRRAEKQRGSTWCG